MKAKIAKVCTSFIDVPDKISVAVYFAGCSIRCKGCQNKVLWEQSSGEDVLLEDLLSKVQGNPLAEYLVFLGGEPTDQMGFLIEFCKKEKSFKKALYTGREFEVLPGELVKELDFIVCGPFKTEEFVEGRFPASKNQRVFRKENGSWSCITF
ncbi:TPA: hypothetical protein DEO28_02660 [Candidatus Dependentiae bacterium]|nr:MAG: Anaerobic ribonucleoside-triphosphate reductase-activating protein [candidate division TM6 bacterium GW2011_GWE2_31_21]KKP53191.1 MAG: Anaerobic ribonucleoside-triphosphate reductase-activating protein [candidate division TM6 bacterium GW2011_GWF2_33_332]HBS48009.1 hypothetical protein [Candidatus Dependentiae bacterium]HBZ73387.1 hypothetical protein [Candidatus Dependentiae bacterium]